MSSTIVKYVVLTILAAVVYQNKVTVLRMLGMGHGQDDAASAGECPFGFGKGKNPSR